MVVDLRGPVTRLFLWQLCKAGDDPKYNKTHVVGLWTSTLFAQL